MKKKRFNLILVIDDEELDLFLAEKILNGSEIARSLMFYNNAKLALAFLQNLKDTDQAPDLILLDLCMPVFSGEEFLVSYHQSVPELIRKKIKIVVLTAYKYYDEAKDINCNRFPSLSKIIEKPLKIEELEEI